MEGDGAAALAAPGMLTLGTLAEEVPGDPGLVDDLIARPQPLNQIIQLQGPANPAIGMLAMADNAIPGGL